MIKRNAIVLAICLMLLSAVAWAQTPVDAVADVVANSGAFPAGTSVVSVTTVGGGIVIDLSAEAVTADFGDTLADSMVEAICGALGAFEDIKDIEVTVAGQPLWAYLPKATESFTDAGTGIGVQSQGMSVKSAISVLTAQSPLSAPNVTPQSGELAGKLVVLHPSHGSYASSTSWYRAMRTYCGPNPATNRPSPWYGSTFHPSDYYYWTRGFQWPSYYEDDMSPETIRFLYAYCKSAGAATYCSRNLDKNAGAFDYAKYGYPAPPTSMRPLPKWQVAAKYNLQDQGYPQSVWDEPALPAESDKDIRARAYLTNYLMQTLGYNYNNTVSLSLHSNASTSAGGQEQARGTETYYYTTQYPTQQAKSPQYCTAMETAVINAIRNQYDGTWAESQYNAVATPIPPEWYTPYGTYRGYVQNGATNAMWQDRGVKTSNFGEIRECKCPAQLMELLFHDDWKFYPDQAFHQDAIFRSTVAWGMYTGICNFFGVTPKPRLDASVDSVSFPTIVGPGAAVSGTVSVKNLGQAWCWGNKMTGTVWGPYTVWALKGAAADQFGAAGSKIVLPNDGYYYPGDVATFNVSLTAPAATGLYTTSWRMVKDDAKGGDFGAVASAQIQVDADAPEITVTSPEEGKLYGPSVAVSFSATDALSQVASLTADIDGTAVESGSTVTLGSGSHTLTVTAVDTFGNTATKAVTFQVDADAPVITITSPTAGSYQHFGTVAVQFSAVDAPAGVASVSATIDGNAVANGASIDLLWGALGTHTLTVTATDTVGNTGSKSISFEVIATLESLSGAINQLYAAGQIDNEGIQTSLLAKLAKYSKDQGDIPDAKSYLVNFTNEVQAQSGKHITAPAADLLLSDSAYIIAHLPAQ